MHLFKPGGELSLLMLLEALLRWFLLPERRRSHRTVSWHDNLLFEPTTQMLVLLLLFWCIYCCWNYLYWPVTEREERQWWFSFALMLPEWPHSQGIRAGNSTRQYAVGVDDSDSLTVFAFLVYLHCYYRPASDRREWERRLKSAAHAPSTTDDCCNKWTRLIRLPSFLIVGHSFIRMSSFYIRYLIDKNAISDLS
jgi:hypothetical protein